MKATNVVIQLNTAEIDYKMQGNSDQSSRVQ